MSIIYNRFTNTIMISGGRINTPYSFDDIYYTDRNLRWGVFDRIMDGYYKTTAKLYFYRCYFFHRNSVLIFDNVCKHNIDNIVYITDQSHIDFISCHFHHYEKRHLGKWKINNEVLVNFENCSWMTNRSSKKIYFEIYPNNKENVTIKRCKIEISIKNVNCSIIDSLICGKYGTIDNPKTDLQLENTNILTDYNRCFYINSKDIVINGGKYDAKNELCYIIGPSNVTFKNSELLKSNILTRIPNDKKLTFKISYDILFKVTDENNELVDKKIKITNNNGEIIYNSIIPDSPIELPKYTFNTIGDGNRHSYNIDDYTYHLPYKIEIYDELQTYYEGYINELDNNHRVIELNISIPNRNIFSEIDELKEMIQIHRDTVESKIDAPISSRSSHTPEDVWTYSNRELSNPDNYKVDISNLALESTVQSIKSQTDKLEFNDENNRVKAECIANSSGEIPSETEAQIDNIESMLTDHIEQLKKHDKKIFNKLITNG